MNEEKKVPFKWEYGEETISLQLGMYANNQRLYIGMITHTEDGAEPFADMTVNLPGYSLDPGEAFISGDISKDLLRFIKAVSYTHLMDSEQATPSLSQAQRLKKYSQEGHLTLDMMRVIMGEEKKSDLDRVTFTSDTLRKYFPKSYTPQRMQETIIKLLEAWQKKRQRDQER